MSNLYQHMVGQSQIMHRRGRDYVTVKHMELRNASRTLKPHGKRECARRRRQIAEGRLTESNGLVR